MEKSKLLPVIAAIMITSMVVSMLSISTTTVSATPDVTAIIDRLTVKPGSYVLTITVTAGATAIDNVRIIVPSTFGNFAPTIKVPKDNVVELAATDNENVVLAAGTKVKLIGLATVRLYKNTPLIRVAGDNVYYENQAGTDSENLRLVDNVTIKKDAIVNATGLTTNDNVLLVEKRTLALDENDVVTIAETVVVRVSGNIVRLPENTLLKVRDDTNARNLTTGDNVTTEKAATLVLNNGINWVTQASASVIVLKGGLQSTLPAGAWVRLWVIPGETDDNRVTLAAGSKVSLDADTTVMLYENQQVTRVAPGATENVLLTDPAAAENQPKDWMQAVISATTVEWKGIGENRIAPDASLAFQFAVTVPNVSGAENILVRTTDISGVPVITKVTLTVDNTPPTVTIAASPSWAKDNVAVTITVTASEKLAKLDNVMVAENNAPNTQVIMTPTTADNIVWTGTYTTGDNVLRDGTATIYVIGAQFEDLVGNAGSDTESTFTVDRMKPPTPALTALTSFITENATLTPAPGLQVKRASWLLEGTAQDNFLGGLVTQEGMTVKIRVGTTVYTPTVDASGYFYQSITLAEGKQEVGVQYVDKAGNVGTENAENITLDTTKPSVTMVSPAAGAIINDNKPLISLTISDATLGIDNRVAGFDATDNSGYTVQLRRDGDNAVLATLTSITPPTSDPFTSFTFENDYPTELVDNRYNIYVIAGDNLQSDNTYFSFTIDTTKPTWTQAQLLAAVTVKDPTTLNVLGTTTKKTSWLISGGARKAGSTIKVYVGADAATATLKGTPVTASTTLNANTLLYDYSLTIALSEGANQSVFIEEIDTASNTSGLVLLGTYTVDATPPVIALSAPAVDTTTDAAQITVSGAIADAIVTDPQVLGVTIDCTGASVAKTVYLDANGSFETTVPLVEGANVINVVAMDGLVTPTSGNQAVTTRTVTRTVTPLTTYAIILVVVALILAAIAIFRKEMK